jgi:hypothetical protein
VKGSTEGIRNALANQLLGDATTILVSRTKTGHFQSLASVPEFRDLVIHPATLPAAPGARLSAVLSKASGVISPTERRRPEEAGSAESRALSAGTGGTVATAGSATHAVPPDVHRTPMPGLVTVPVETPADPNAETELYGDPIDSKLELGPQSLPGSAAPVPESQPKPATPFDWMPVLVGLIILQFFAIIYLIAVR